MFKGRGNTTRDFLSVSRTKLRSVPSCELTTLHRHTGRDLAGSPSRYQRANTPANSKDFTSSIRTNQLGHGQLQNPNKGAVSATARRRNPSNTVFEMEGISLRRHLQESNKKLKLDRAFLNHGLLGLHDQEHEGKAIAKHIAQLLTNVG